MLHDGKKLALFLYSADAECFSREGLVSMLETVAVRPEEDLGFFRFGNADVSFDQFTTKVLGGKERLVLSFTWKNRGDSISTFDDNIIVLVFQNGIELNESILIGNTDSGTRVMPGKQLDILKVFDLREETGDICLIVDKKDDQDNAWSERTHDFSIK